MVVLINSMFVTTQKEMALLKKSLFQLSISALGVTLSIMSTASLASASVVLNPIPKQITTSPLPDDLLEQGVELYRNEQYDKAIQLWQQALTAYQTSGNRQGEGNTLGKLGIAYRKLEQYSKAIDYYQQALAIYQETDNASGQRRILGNVGNAYALIGQYAQALDYQTQSLELALTLQDRVAERRSLSNLGAIYADQNQYEVAIDYYQQSLSIARELGDSGAEAILLCNLGSAYNSWKKEHNLAIDYYQKCLELAQLVDDRWLVAEALSSIGFAYEGLESFEIAMDYYDRGIAEFKSISSFRSATITLNNRAHTLLKWSNAQAGGDAAKLQEAEENLRQAIQMLDDIRNNQVSLDADRVSIFDTQVMTYNLLQQVLIAQNQPEKALEVSEEGRSQALSILLRNKQSSSSRPFNLEQIKQFAQEQNTTLVEYSIVPEDNVVHQGKARGKASELYIWVIQPDGKVAFRQVNLKSQGINLTEVVKLSLETIGSRNRGGLVNAEPDEADHTEQLKTLHQLLIEPIIDLLPKQSTEPVIFIPQNELFQVPFPALLDADNIHLIERHTILTAPSIETLSLSNQIYQARDKRDFSELTEEDWLVVGNPTMPEVWNSEETQEIALQRLPGAEQEAKDIGTQFDVTPLIGNAATESKVRQQIELSRIIHLATHGLLEYGNPKDSAISDTPGAIALAPDDTHDGLLTAAELSGFDLNAELVVLSACDTGLGDITGDGVIGLSRSLMQAGAPSIIVSLWSVPDAPTAKLMTEFYRQLSQGENKAQALRQAMLKTFNSHPQPSDWAAFTLIGSIQ